jgi:hypothetical protein
MPGLAAIDRIQPSEASLLELPQHLIQPHHHFSDLSIVDDVPHSLPANRDVPRRIGDDQPGVKQLLEPVRDRHLRDLESIGDLRPRLARVLPQVADDGRLHDVPESVDGILRVVTVRGAGVSGHLPSVAHRSSRVYASESKSTSHRECSVIRFPHVKGPGRMQRGRRRPELLGACQRTSTNDTDVSATWRRSTAMVTTRGPEQSTIHPSISEYATFRRTGGERMMPSGAESVTVVVLPIEEDER